MENKCIKKRDYLSVERTVCVKGILAVAVLFHHLYQNGGAFKSSSIGTVLQALGYLSVSVFLFLSGYGLMYSYKHKGKQYLRSMVKKRVIPFYIIIVFCTLLYIGAGLALGRSFGLGELTLSFLIGDTVIINGWYLQVQLLLYLLFLFSFYVAEKNSDLLKTAVLTVCVAAYIFLAAGLLASTWYESVAAFVIGVLFCHFREKIDTLLASLKMWIVCFALLAAAFAATFMLMLTFYQTGASVIIKGLNSVVFVMCAAEALMRLPVACGVTRFLGSISLEIYVTQGIFLELFRCERLYVCSILLYTVLVIAATVVSSLMLHPLFRRIYSIWK